jgi:CRP-like cAMP-binding protein
MVNIVDLKKQVLFQDIDERDLHKIAKNLEVLEFKEGEYLYKENEERKGLYLVHSGKIEVTNSALGGVEYSLFSRGPGDFVGTHVIFGEKKHGTNAKARENSVVFLLPKEAFEFLENEDVVAAYLIMKNVAHVMSEDQLNLCRKINELTTSMYHRYIHQLSHE